MSLESTVSGVPGVSRGRVRGRLSSARAGRAGLLPLFLGALVLLVAAGPSPAQDRVPRPPAPTAEELRQRLKREKPVIGEDGEKVWARSEFNRARDVPGYVEVSKQAYDSGAQRTANVRLGDMPYRLEGWQNIQRHMPVPAVLPGKPEGTGRTNMVFGSTWVPLGPFRVDNGQPTYPNTYPRLNVSGRIACVAVDPTDPDTLYLGGAQGGVWKTTDAGANWTPLTDQQASLAMGHIAIDPNDPQRIWAGTGEHHFSGDSYYGIGILFSADGGATWANRAASPAQLGYQYISRLRVDRTNSSRVMVASSAGLIDTTDGFVSSFITRRTGAWSDVLQDPNDSNLWHAAQIGGAIERSTDGGATFAPVFGAPVSTGGGTGRIHLTAHPGTGPGGTILYAVVVNSSSSIIIHKSTDSGASWTQVTAPTTEYNRGSQYWYDIYIAVSPTNSNHVAVGGVRSYGSTDGGASFVDVSDGRNIHDDHHYGLWVQDGATTYLYDCNDGGIFRSSDQGTTWTSLNVGLTLLQFETIDISPADENLMIGGTQDNGTDMFNGTDVWTHTRGGDGGFTRFDPNDPTTVYGIYVRGHVYRSRTYGFEGTWEYVTNGITDPGLSSEFNFYSPLEVNPIDGNYLLLGGDNAWRTADQGDNWASTGTPFGTTQIARIAFSPSDVNTVLVGANNGWVARTTNFTDPTPANVVWTNIQDIGSSVTGILVHPTNPDIVFACTSSFSTNRVMVSTNATQPGASFTSVTSNLPVNVQPESIVMDHSDTDTLYLGTAFGVFRTIDSGATWQNFSTGLPLMAAVDLRLDPERNLLVAATHGRGLWRVSKPTIAISDVTISNDRNNPPASNGAIDPGERADLVIELANSGEEDATSPTVALTALTPGITIHQGASTYPTVTAYGGTQTNTTTFDIEIAGLGTFDAGDELDFEIAFSSNGTTFERTIPLTLRVGEPTETTLLDADFNASAGGFTTALDSGTTDWARDATKPYEGAAAFHGFDVDGTNLATLTSPVVNVPSGQRDLEFSFQHTWYFEGGNWDAGVMEVRRDGVAWIDIEDPTASILSIENGYTGAIVDGGPLGSGKMGWVNGASGQPFERTVLHLDPTVWGGTTFEARWRVASDAFYAPPAPSGWWIDDVQFVARTWSSVVPVSLSGIMLE